MKISEIKTRTEEKHPFFFTRKTLRFFGQTRAMFKVSKCTDGRFLIPCPRTMDKRLAGHTVRYFNPLTNNLDLN